MNDDQTVPPAGAPNLDSLEEKSPTSPTEVLEGAWFRRERERLAIGRRTVATHLQIAEYHLAKLEQRRLPVPSPWLASLAELGFRLPASRSEVRPTADTNPQEVAPAPESALAPLVQVTKAAARTALTQEANTPARTPLNAQPSPRPEPVAPPADARPALGSLVEGLPASDQPPPLPSLPRGRWLRERRYALGLLIPGVRKAVGVTEDELRTVEVEDLPIPPRWLPALLSLHFHAAPPTDRRPSWSEALTGEWLQAQRQKKHLSVLALGERLGIRPSLLRRIEAGRLPLPPEWLPGLRRLGFELPDASPPSLQKNSSATVKPALPPQNRPPSARPPSAPLSGAWMRRHRERLGLMQKTLSERLRVDQSTVCHCEREDGPIQLRWIPILKKLGFPVSAEPPTPAPAASLTGAWLRRERQRMRLFIQHLCKQLDIAAKELRSIEDQNAPLPREWLPKLKKLGFPVSASALPAPKSPTVKAPPSPLPAEAWLRVERERLGLTRQELAKYLKKKPDTLRPVENGSSPLPKRWLAPLRKLGFQTPVGPAPSAAADRSAKPARTIQPAAPPAPLKPSPPPAAPSADPEHAMAELVVSHRLKLGRYSRQSPAEVLIAIGNELRQAGLEQAVHYDELEAALTRLFRAKPSRVA